MRMTFLLTEITTLAADYLMEVHHLLIYNRCIIGTRKYFSCSLNIRVSQEVGQKINLRCVFGVLYFHL
jgi:hypothetical protein